VPRHSRGSVAIAARTLVYSDTAVSVSTAPNTGEVGDVYQGAGALSSFFTQTKTVHLDDS
jgi:hypothetical protein